jgi:hypothetical protein
MYPCKYCNGVGKHEFWCPSLHQRAVALAAILALAACHEPTGRVSEGEGRAFPDIGTAQRITVINGTPGDDFLQGTTGPDRIEGGAGNDIICGGPCDPALIDRIQSEGW